MNRILQLNPVFMSVGAWCILIISISSGLVLAVWPITQRDGLEMWTYARVHEETYAKPITLWNEQSAEKNHETVNLYVLDGAAQVRRTLSAFWSGTPVADVMEVEQDWMGRFFSGPQDSIGFADITDRLRDEGIHKKINEPAFGLWTSRGRIFGIPHDVHPVMLAYRADILGEMGIDITQAQTWDEFAKLMMIVLKHQDGSGQRIYPMSIWHTNMQLIETLMLQAGGGTFNSNGEIIIASDANALVLATVIRWCIGEKRIGVDAPEFQPSGNQLRLEGRVLCTLMPDWLAGVWKQDLPQLKGKLKLMPLPAWKPGGRRTSVMGGTMIAIPKSTENFEDAWAFAKHLYLSEEVAERLFQRNNIISPVKALWNCSFYKQPDPYFSNQVVGQMYIDLAPSVPTRTSTPYRGIAISRISEVVHKLRQYAEQRPNFDRDALIPVAKELLADAEERVIEEMQQNYFLSQKVN
ncbi:ABC transporter substrate-binding protein [Poriferisphaera sp. WC338]|uniref:ABC transporter substrate-binding protein n=1 Tax=Poriferisphaera sp. WC338 TaxID=3425129 RepID=UPI003D81B219